MSNYLDCTHQLYGSPDPSVPASTTPCHGCGAILHCRDPGVSGYMPSQIFLAATPTQLKEILCQRCHLLKEFNLAIDVTAKTMEFQAIADEIKKKSPALLLIMVDLVDLPHSFYSGFAGWYVLCILLLAIDIWMCGSRTGTWYGCGINNTVKQESNIFPIRMHWLQLARHVGSEMVLKQSHPVLNW